MSHYYGTMQGSRTRVTRCGTKQSGIAATLATWGAGIRITLEHDATTNSDTLTLERIPWTSAADADATGRVLLRVPLGSLSLREADTVDAMPTLVATDGRQ